LLFRRMVRPMALFASAPKYFFAMDSVMRAEFGFWRAVRFIALEEGEVEDVEEGRFGKGDAVLLFEFFRHSGPAGVGA